MGGAVESLLNHLESTPQSSLSKVELSVETGSINLAGRVYVPPHMQAGGRVEGYWRKAKPGEKTHSHVIAHITEKDANYIKNPTDNTDEARRHMATHHGAAADNVPQLLGDEVSEHNYLHSPQKGDTPVRAPQPISGGAPRKKRTRQTEGQTALPGTERSVTGPGPSRKNPMAEPASARAQSLKQKAQENYEASGLVMVESDHGEWVRAILGEKDLSFEDSASEDDVNDLNKALDKGDLKAALAHIPGATESNLTADSPTEFVKAYDAKQKEWGMEGEDEYAKAVFYAVQFRLAKAKE